MISPAAERLEALGYALYGSRWKADLAADLDVTARTLRLYTAGDRGVPPKILARVEDLARAKIERLAELVGKPRKVKPSSDLPAIRPRGIGLPGVRKVDFAGLDKPKPIDVEALLREADELAAAKPSDKTMSMWTKDRLRDMPVRSRETGADLILKHVGSYKLQIWGDAGRLEAIDIRTENGKAAIADLVERGTL